jgi:DNA-directed RNA polymerase subunit M/transcription elongation factor TFIIS
VENLSVTCPEPPVFYIPVLKISPDNRFDQESWMSNCPKCGSKNTEWTDCKTVENKTVVVCICSDCGHTWEQSL